MATWSYQVKYVYDNSEGSPFVTPVDITDNVITIENMTDIGKDFLIFIASGGKIKLFFRKKRCSAKF